MRVPPLASIALSFLLCAAQARADGPRPWSRHFLVGVDANLLPFPMLDAAVFLEVVPVPWASLEVGGGVSTVQRPMARALLHLRAPLGKWAPGIEGGFQVGPLVWHPSAGTDGFSYGSLANAPSYRERIDAALFGRMGGTFAFRSASDRLQVRAQFGATTILNRSATYCLGNDGHVFGGCRLAGVSSVLPYLGGSLAYAFDL